MIDLQSLSPKDPFELVWLLRLREELQTITVPNGYHENMREVRLGDSTTPVDGELPMIIISPASDSWGIADAGNVDDGRTDFVVEFLLILEGSIDEARSIGTNEVTRLMRGAFDIKRRLYSLVQAGLPMLNSLNTQYLGDEEDGPFAVRLSASYSYLIPEAEPHKPRELN